MPDRVNDFIKRHDLLKEDYRVEEAFVEFNYSDLSTRLTEVKESSVLAIVGAYGAGKSTALNKIVAKSDDEEILWLRFDAWRYPERKGLWDGLIIEIARQMGEERSVLRKLDGHKSVIGRWASPVAEVFDQVKQYFPADFFNWTKETVDTGGAVSKVGEKVADLFERSPAKRSYEVERILADLLQVPKASRINIIAEDIDRSGADGINFLETLSFFLKNTQDFSSKTIVVIAPISDESFRKSINSYLKCVDYFEFFVPTLKSANDFIHAVIDEGVIDKSRPEQRLGLKQFASLIHGLFKEFPTQMNMRKLKLILRSASLTYRQQIRDGHEPDWRMTVCFEAMKYVGDGEGETYKDMYSQTKSGKTVSSTSMFASFLGILNPRSQEDSIYKIDYSRDDETEVLKSPRDSFQASQSENNLPWYYHDPFGEERSGLYFSDFYLKY